MNITFKISHLQAVSLFAARNDIRRYLGAVAINKGYLVATDGTALAAMPLNHEEPLDVDHLELLIPLSAVEVFLKMLNTKQRSEGLATITKHEKGYVITHETLNAPFTPIIANYIHWQRVVPDDRVQVEPYGFFNWSYMIKFNRAVKVLTGSTYGVSLKPHGTKAANVYIMDYPEFIGVLMPMRFNTDYNGPGRY